MQFIRLYGKRFLWTANILLAILLLCTKAIPYINPSNAWLIGLLGLATPFIAGANILFIILWIVFKKWKYTLLSILCIVASWNIFSVGIAGHFLDKKNNVLSNKNTFTVMSYNVRLLNYYDWNNDKNTRQKLIQFIQQQSPSVLCLQEFFSNTDVNNIAEICNKGGYGYYAINKNFDTKRGFFGDIIFSKFPIQNHAALFLDTTNTQQYQYADIAINNKLIRVFNLHLQSIKLSKKDLVVSNAKTNQEQYQQTKSILQKLKKSFTLRGAQANNVAATIAQSALPIIVCGDMNDIPSSYTYFTIRGKLQDAFLDKGFGLGRTYNNISPVLRIDNIFFDQQKITVLDFKKHKVFFSDHYPIVATFATN
jgi:endonuclease/exonuclease/phosphatase family metal-dependent hydrolase